MKKSLIFLLLCVSFQIVGQTDTKVDWRLMGNNKDATFYDVQKDFYEYWADKTPTKGQGYTVFKRWEAQMIPRVYPTGDMTLPSQTYEIYTDWLKRSDHSTIKRNAPSNFSSLGPNAVPSGYDSGAGRVDFLRFDPTNSNTLYVGSPDGGLWKSIDAGATWTTNTDFLSIIGCSDIAIDPTNTQNMYLATGNWESDRRSIGVLKSTNGGTTWTTTGLVWSATDNYKIRRLIMDPTNPQIMMIATDGGVFRTTDGWGTFTNGGLDGNYNIHDIEFNPGDPNIVYASGVQGSDVFWKSTMNGMDGTWAAATTGLPAGTDVSRILIGVTAIDDTYVYLLAGNGMSGYKGLYRSTDSGATFSTRSTTPNILQSSKTGTGTGGQAEHDLAIVVDSANKEKVTIGGINQWRSTNGGTTWTIFTYWLGNDPAYPGEGDPSPPYKHADIQDIQYLPGSSTTMFTTADGGIYKTIDDGVNWTDITNNLSIAQQTNVALSATTEGLMVAGLQDIGTIKRSAAGVYSVINGGDGEAAFIDRTNDLVMITSNPNGAHDLSYDGGLNKQKMNGIPAGTLFYSPIIQDPVSATTCFAGGRANLYKNVDFEYNPDTWVTLGSPPSTGTNASIIRFVIAPSNTSIIYVIKGNGYDATTLSKSIDGGTSFTNITGTLPTSIQMSNLEVSNTDPDKVWLTYSGYEPANKVFRSTNGGTSWENMSGGLPNLPMNTIVHVNGSLHDELYLGGDVGIYYYDNTQGVLPGNWATFNVNLPNSKVTDLEIFYPTNKLRASTYGRGTWESPISTTVPVVLNQFTGENKGDYNILEWNTESEIDLDYYEIQSSSNGRDFEKIGKKLASSTNGNGDSYTFIDNQPSSRLTYYRLKIVDLNASYEYSNVIAVARNIENNIVTIFPNPVNDVLTIKGISNDNTRVRVYSETGKLIMSQVLSNSEQLDISNLVSGSYFIEIDLDKENSVIKSFIKI